MRDGPRCLTVARYRGGLCEGPGAWSRRIGRRGGEPAPAAYRAFDSALSSARFRELLVDLAEWLDVDDWQSSSAISPASPRRNNRSLRRGELERRWRKLLKCAVDLISSTIRPATMSGSTPRSYAIWRVLRASLRAAPRAAERFLQCLDDLQDDSRQAQRWQVGGPFPCHLTMEIPRRKRLGKDAAMLFAAGRMAAASARRQQQAHAPGRRGRSEARRHRSVLAVGLHGARAHRSSLWMCK